MNTFPQSPAEATFAEQSMDEQLKAIRRRSFASDVMNSPGGSASLLESAQMNSPSLMMATTPRSGSGGGGGGSEVGSMMGMSMGSPSSILSRGKGKFRSAFSSPSLNILAGGRGRRRSSLGMTYMINSIVNSPTGAGEASSSSSYHSPAESATTYLTDSSVRLHRRPSDTETTSSSDNDGQQSLYSSSHIRQQLAISAQELLRAEYGDLYPVLLSDPESGLLNDMENMNPEMDSITSMGRTRSNSVSSAGTSRSSGSYSYSCSNEQGQGQGQGRLKLPGPPPSFMNKVRNGAGKYRSNKTYQQQQQQTVRKVGSNATLGNSKPNSRFNSKKFPSHGDLTKYSWDYRKELPID